MTQKYMPDNIFELLAEKPDIMDGTQNGAARRYGVSGLTVKKARQLRSRMDFNALLHRWGR